jgi:murein DD-endopeptidase MepM/ murein hydrolase activator NlpD
MPMNKSKLIFALFLFSFSLLNAQSLKIYGDAKPGAVLIGHADKIKSVSLGKQKLLVDKNGYFVFGFDRDAKGKYILKIRYKNKKSETRKFVLEKTKYEIQRLRIAKSYVKPPKTELKRIKNESAEMKKARAKIEKIDSAFYAVGFTMPVDSPRITETFGGQRILNGVRKSPHNGTDFGADEGKPVYAISDGIVVIAGDNFYYNGNFVLLAHGQGLTSVYLHMSKLDVKTGDKILKGQKIGEIGSTGRSTGPHLHLGVQWYNKRIDPLSLLELNFDSANETE